ncbi:Alcohol dehydrogenase-like 6 [Linum perenne]
MTEERQIHLDCKNASNPYHECVEYCFKRIAESKVRAAKEVGLEEMPEEDVTKLIGRRKKLYEFKRKMYEENKANQMEIVVENKRLEPPLESRGVSKQNRLKERKKKMSKLLDANDLDMKTKYMLDTQEGDIGEIQEMGKRSLLLPAEMFSTRRVYKMPTKSKLKMSDRFGDDDTFSRTANCGSEVITTTKLSVIESVFKLREAQPSAIVEEMRKSLVDLRLIMAIFPRIFGHEASRIFESIGDGVTEFKEGVHVLTVFTVECRTCKHCTSGKSNLCQCRVSASIRWSTLGVLSKLS